MDGDVDWSGRVDGRAYDLIESFLKVCHNNHLRIISPDDSGVGRRRGRTESFLSRRTKSGPGVSVPVLGIVLDRV